MNDKPFECQQCKKKFKTEKGLNQHKVDMQHYTDTEAFAKDWTRKCECCGAKPVVYATGMCGPCTWGEADTVGGNW